MANRVDPAGWPMPTVFIQWKGTDVCLDLHCECGAEDFGHFDGLGAYAIQCHNCGRKYNLPTMLRLEPFDDRYEPVVTTGESR